MIGWSDPKSFSLNPTTDLDRGILPYRFIAQSKNRNKQTDRETNRPPITLEEGYIDNSDDIISIYLLT